MDLDRHPDNGWALRGLSDAFTAQDRAEEARCAASSVVLSSHAVSLRCLVLLPLDTLLT